MARCTRCNRITDAEDEDPNYVLCWCCVEETAYSWDEEDSNEEDT